MDKTRTVGQTWLANELGLHLLTLKKVYQRPIQSVNSFKSYRANKLYIYRQTDTHSRKPFFRVQRVSKRGHLTKPGGGGCQILHKSNTFSDENVKMFAVK